MGVVGVHAPLLAAAAVVVAYLLVPEAALWLWRPVPEASLTFDDGPNPGFTPQVLDLLRKAQARAAFFLIGTQVDLTLARQIHEAGHLVGVHGMRHRHAWFSGPVASWLEVARGAAAIERATGVRPRLYRPAYGAVNLATLACCWRLGLRPALWHRAVGEWLPGVTPDDILHRASAARDGEVLLLHDGGQQPAGTAAMVAALPEVLRHNTRGAQGRHRLCRLTRSLVATYLAGGSAVAATLACLSLLLR